ncbi:MAG: hypothetical protein ACM3SV_01995 [Betaproteobacteria bacterium]
MRFWEYKDRNMHRRIIDYVAPASISRGQIEFDVHNEVVHKYAPTWARCFTFGALIQFCKTPQLALEELFECVDGSNKREGVWQWVIAIDHDQRRVFAAHMRMIGSLHPMFEQTVGNLIQRGYNVQKLYLAKPSLFKAIDKYLAFAQKALPFLNRMQMAAGLIAAIYFAYRYFA